MGFRAANADRLAAAAGAATLQALLLALLVVGLGVDIPALPGADLRIFAVAPTPPPPEPVVRPREDRRSGNEGSKPNLRSEPAEIQATPARLPVVPPVVAAPMPATGDDPSAGAADLRGPGMGAGGRGAGDGAGDGGGTPARRIRGRLQNSDYPRAVLRARIGGTVTVRYAVEADGRVTGCRIAESSGSAELDDTTCRLVTERFLFEPARDGAGRPTRSTITEYHSWVVRERRRSRGLF